MSERSMSEMRLYAVTGDRLYINGDERTRFLAAADLAEEPVRTLCMTLAYTGCRLSEALALTTTAVQPGPGIVTIRSLKKRTRIVMREVPIPPVLADALVCVHGIGKTGGEPLWPWHRVTAWRRVKAVMENAGIDGLKATPKGLRHGFGIHAIRTGVQLNLLQKWLGHTNMATTAIYANATGPEEREVARRMWA